MNGSVDNAAFFDDPFFAKELVIARAPALTSTASITGIIATGLDPQRDGAMTSRGGQWAQIACLVSEHETYFGSSSHPEQHDEWTIDGETYRVEAWQKRGDVFTVKAVANTRRMR